MTMTHPGLPLDWAQWLLAFMVVATLWALLVPVAGEINRRRFSLQALPLIGNIFHYLATHSWPLLIIKVVFAAIFLIVIAAGLWGTPLPERNLATALTWNLWWGAIVIAIVFTGSAWCAVCPWDTLASGLVKFRLWRRSNSNSRLQLTVPKHLRNLWPATILFVALSWLELGVGVTASPYATAAMALLMLLLATLAMALFKDKAFCRYFCPVGRTVGAYSQLAPIALRPVDDDICKDCETLECYHGSLIASDGSSEKNIDRCPTRLVMGRLQESTYCTSCGNCSQSCPSQNINWSLRSPSVEAIQEARPHSDEAFFMLTLLVLTSFHGLTMLDGWQTWVSQFAQTIGDSGQLLASFSVGLVLSWLLPIAGYWLLMALNVRLLKPSPLITTGKFFSGFAFAAIPLAFSYHIAHNLNHLLREASDWPALIANPLGIGTQPLSMMEKHMRHGNMLISENMLFTLQTGLLIIGFYLALQVIRQRGHKLFQLTAKQLLPVIVFALIISGFNLWMLMQDMVMRM